MIDLTQIAGKWQKRWQEEGIFKTREDPKKKKYYVLEMYPYPSASFLHMGHVRNYTIGDVYARFRRMNGYNVLYPMGYDSFGLPAETAAKKEGIHPQIYTDRSIEKIMEYQKALGNSYDWDRVIASHDIDYYKWNQYFFNKMFALTLQGHNLLKTSYYNISSHGSNFRNTFEVRPEVPMVSLTLTYNFNNFRRVGNRPENVDVNVGG